METKSVTVNSRRLEKMGRFVQCRETRPLILAAFWGFPHPPNIGQNDEASGNRCFSWPYLSLIYVTGKPLIYLGREFVPKILIFGTTVKTHKQPEVAANRATVLCHT